jgi:hypothetical protein
MLNPQQQHKISSCLNDDYNNSVYDSIPLKTTINNQLNENNEQNNNNSDLNISPTRHRKGL